MLSLLFAVIFLANVFQTGFGIEWRQYPGECLQGSSGTEIITQVNSVAECQSRCENELTFLCSSVEYNPTTAFCRLRFDTSINTLREFPCQENYNLYEIREDVTWTSTDGGCHFGNIDRTLQDISSVELCREQCLVETEFRCLSFDFYRNAVDPSTSTCLLSRENSKSRFVAFPCQEPNVVYYERDRWPATKIRKDVKLNNTVVKEMTDMIPRDCIGACLVESSYVCEMVNYDETTKVCSLLDATNGVIGETPDNKSTAYILTDRFKWHYFPSACIVGYDVETIYNATASGCLEACETSWNFICVSVDYHIDGRCNLQAVWSKNTPLSVPCYEEESVYYELNEEC